MDEKKTMKRNTKGTKFSKIDPVVIEKCIVKINFLLQSDKFDALDRFSGQEIGKLFLEPHPYS